MVSWEWLRHVTYFGWFFLVFCYAFYFACFGFFVYWFWNRKQYLISLFALPSAWVVLEWIRTEIPVWGFGWNLLAYSQSSNLVFSPIASFVGAYGLSWLIVFVNLAFLFLFELAFRHKREDGILSLFSFLILGFILSFYFGSQWRSVDAPKIQADTVLIASIQGNIPQEGKWDPKNKDLIIKTYEGLSRIVPAEEKPDLIIWPEAAFPGYFNLDRDRSRVMDLAKELGTPILLGSPRLELIQTHQTVPSTAGTAFQNLSRNVPGTGEAQEVATEVSYNSAFLVDDQSSVVERYDKMRLVPFGEYVPWRLIFGPIGIERLAYSFGVSDFVAGKEAKVFSLKEKHQFSVLICFEDIFPFLARRFAEKGAEFLIVITNDAWFGKSAAPYQHLQASIFRAIENGIPLIRSANTGVSAFIDRTGRVIDRVKDRYGNDIFIAGGLLRSVELRKEKTFYRKWGYQFPFYGLAFVGIGFIVSLRTKPF